MMTAWCLALAFFAPWVAGTPVYWLLRGGRVLRQAEWLWVPFVGLAAIICPLQTLVVFADLPLVRTSPWLWSATGVGWGILLVCRCGRASLRQIPWRVVCFALAVYLGQGVAVVTNGVERYRGNLHTDQYHYIVLAQFLMEEPFSTGWENLGERPWLVLPLLLKNDRIGQSVVNGFFAVTAGRDALELFFPTLLLGPALMVPAMFLLGPHCGLSRRWTTWAALTAGAAPGVAHLVTVCYFSHAMCLPALVAFLAAVIRLSRGGGWSALPCAGATLVLGFSVYTEFAPLFAGTAAVALSAGLLRRHISVARVAGVGTALVLACALNPAAVVSAKNVWERSARGSATMRTHCRTSAWVATIWLHGEKAILTGGRVDMTVAHVFFYGITGAAACGGLVLTVRAVRSGRRLLPALACPALLVPPVALRLMRPEAEYVIGKLVVTLTPVAVLFLARGLNALSRSKPPLRCAATVVGALVFALLAVQSGLDQRSLQRGGNDVGPARVWNDPQLQEMCSVLRAHEPTTVVIALENDGGGGFPATATSALCYHGRHHRMRLAAPQRAWFWDLATVPTPQLTHLTDLPPGTLLVTRPGPHPFSSASDTVVVTSGSYQLVRLSEPGTVRWDKSPPAP
jgi:hypothetical protein